jgi:hypothetical protein
VLTNNTPISESVVPGLNSNIQVNDQSLHVQTEDLGRGRAVIVSHVFSSSGQVVRVVRFDYAKHVDHPNLRSILPRALQVQHVAVIRKLQEEGGDLPADPGTSDATPTPCLISDAEPVSSEYAVHHPGVLHQKMEPALWDRLVARAKNERELRKTATMIALSSSPAGKPKSSPDQDDKRPSSVAIPVVQEPVPDAEEPSEPALERKSHSWDAAVDRVRRESTQKITIPTEAAHEVEPSELKARAAYNEGREKLMRQDLEGALVAWAIAVQHRPQNPRYRSSLLALLGRFER